MDSESTLSRRGWLPVKEKRVSAAGVTALKAALTEIYWYKPDLRGFLIAALTQPELIGRLNWDDYKRNVVGALIDYMIQHQRDYQDDLLRLFVAVADFRDFSHLERLDNGAEKARRAKAAVAALKAYVAGYAELLADEQQAAERRRLAREAALQTQGVRDRLSGLFQEFLGVVSLAKPQERGYKLERLVKALFELFDLDPRASFVVVGEQIDGAFSFENTDYLFEAKWQKVPVDVPDLDAFDGKIRRKLENTLGMFLSVNGFTAAAVETHSSARPLMILIDGSDLNAVLEGRIDFVQLLLRKRRHASQTGGIFLSAREILA